MRAELRAELRACACPSKGRHASRAVKRGQWEGSGGGGRRTAPSDGAVPGRRSGRATLGGGPRGATRRTTWRLRTTNRRPAVRPTVARPEVTIYTVCESDILAGCV